MMHFESSDTWEEITIQIGSISAIMYLKKPMIYSGGKFCAIFSKLLVYQEIKLLELCLC